MVLGDILRRFRVSARPERVHVFGLVLVLVVALAWRVRRIHEAMPYSEHVDERQVVNLVLKMWSDSDLNPHRFNYPTLPLYLVYAGFVAGGALAGLMGGTQDLGEMAGRFYQVPVAAWSAKILFALLSIGGLGILGWIASVTSRRPSFLWLVPAIACLSPSYFRLSSLYLNVDIVGAFFAMCAVAALHLPMPGTSRRLAIGGAHRALLSGAFAGLTIGSKYNLFPILVPCVLWFWLHERRLVVTRVGVLAAAVVTSFLIVTPYAVLDSKAFLVGTIAEIRHYGLGAGAPRTLERGWPMLREHIQHLADSFSWLGIALAAVGCAITAKRNPSGAAILYTYPACLVSFMSLQRVYFERNIVSVHLFVALALAVGILEVSQWTATAIGRLSLRVTPARPVAMLLVAAAALVFFPWHRVAWAYTGNIEPRNEAIQWLRSRIKGPGTVFVDRRLDLDVRTIPKRFHVAGMDKARASSSEDELRPGDAKIAIVRLAAADKFAAAMHGEVVARFKRRSLVSADRGRTSKDATAIVRLR